MLFNDNFFENRKNKSFRPRERPKKGLKNLQSVKTLSAGQNLINNQTAVKTRKQPLTVAAQFHNSLIALMETLNQVCCERARERRGKKFPSAMMEIFHT
jgi:hypothetical protein